jgi:hypothetical protein
MQTKMQNVARRNQQLLTAEQTVDHIVAGQPVENIAVGLTIRAYGSIAQVWL